MLNYFQHPFDLSFVVDISLTGCFYVISYSLSMHSGHSKLCLFTFINILFVEFSHEDIGYSLF